MRSTSDPDGALARHGFTAMGCPCEALFETRDAALANKLGAIVETEARRIEQRFSRYRDDSELARIHRAAGAPVALDAETGALLHIAAELHALSDGRFDVTSGVLRHAWRFDGGSQVPEAAHLASLLARVGWERVRWDGRTLTLPAGMELDLGGIAKEYAVDRALALVSAEAPEVPALVNFGGDLAVRRARRDEQPWRIAIEDPERPGARGSDEVELRSGGLATSGDARRFVWHAGRRLGHILDPRTGWPIADAPRSVTVVAATCLEAGALATLAILNGAGAEEFLRSSGAATWITAAA